MTTADATWTPLLCLLASAGVGVYLLAAAVLSARRGWWERRLKAVERAMGRDG